VSAAGDGRPPRCGAALVARLGAAAGGVAAVPLAAELALLALTALVYRDGLWSVPRWDHLVYLYEASQFDTPWQLLAHAPAWNRAVSVGDHVEFRPLFHLMLGVEQVLFGRAYAAWQAVGIALHALVAVLLLRLGRRAFRSAWPPVLLAALFASALLAAETVVWFHANAYVLCAALLLASLERLLAFLETGGRGAARLCVALAALAAFTYELGPIYCAVAGALLVLSALPAGPQAGHADLAGAAAARRARLATGGAHLAVTAVYVAVSAGDLLLRFGGIAGSDVRAPRLAELGIGAEFAVRQIGFWLGGLAFPALYDIAPGARALFLGLVPPAGASGALGVAAVALVVIGAAGTLRGAVAGAGPGLLAGVAFLVTYSLVVALGRSVPRGLAYTIDQNLQHAYPALLAAIVAVMLAAWTRQRSGPPAGAAARGPWRWLLALGAASLVWVNAASTAALLAEFRHSYDAPKFELIYHVERWHVERWHGHARPDRAAYFRVAEDCPGHDALPWFGLYLRHDTPMAYFIDVIFPATSFNLHRARLPPDARVDEISCAGGAVSPAAVTGRWWQGSRPAEIRPEPAGLEAISPEGRRSALTVDGHAVLAPDWRARGVLSHDGRYIFWQGAIPWHR